MNKIRFELASLDTFRNSGAMLKAEEVGAKPDEWDGKSHDDDDKRQYKYMDGSDDGDD